jgi:hypothetical protein
MTKIVNVAYFGSGVTGNLQSSSTGFEDSRDGWMYYVNTNGGGKFLCSSFGQTNFTIQQDYDRLVQVFPAVSNFVDVAVFQVYSPNNASDIVANYATIQAKVLAAQALVEGAGKGFIANFWAPPGAGMSTPEQITAWTNLRAWMRVVFPNHIDTVDAVANGNNWQTSLSYDNTRPNIAGSIAIANSCLPQLKAILTAWGYSV